MYPTNLILLVTAFTGLAAAGAPPASWSQWPSFKPTSSPTSSRCYTKMGTSTVPWASSTSWSVKYTPCATTTTLVSTVTSNPPYSTTTVTVQTTTTSTAPTTSLTSTVTSTASTVTTTTSTSVSTTTTTTTSSVTATSTVPTSSGFLAIQTSLPGADCDGNCGPAPVTKRRRRSPSWSDTNNFDPRANTSPNYNHSPAIYGTHQYPQGVTCYQFQPSACSTSTAYSTVTIGGTSTGTVTSTVTSAVTSTVIPSATITLTTTTTTTSTSTAIFQSVSTSTATTSSIVTTTTVYAACATNNFADQYNGINIQSLSPTNNPDNSGLETLEIYSAYDCCVAAITDPNYGEVWEFLGNACLVFNNNAVQCTTLDPFTANIASGESTYVVAGNAYCGQISSTSGS